MGAEMSEGWGGIIIKDNDLMATAVTVRYEPFVPFTPEPEKWPIPILHEDIDLAGWRKRIANMDKRRYG
jgi:hypothetical protein